MNYLHFFRLRRGLSQRELAAMLGIHQSLLSRMERGWFRRCPAGCEDRFTAIFGPQWGFDALMNEVPPVPGESVRCETRA